ncbi:GntR family transcriptional regulator [Fictibacillus terranigra]|uniref:GntR family transcriptional regulator n=1 Tax=Fictibacillus terranigra TaxID=3058424 RepID=A0ABT8EC30_9BACL|nr:GntR family transcriptional regulator [Fictibacillus sp. CENA-BCM004]MDN4075481.1 GntR family transcriptional regulator [Fictibacillus sp. CENA-BCM004]
MNHRKHSLYEQVYLSIKDAIIKGRLSPNERLREMKLAEMFNTSRTPIREALRKLERERLVTFESSIGAKVTDLNKETIKSMYECRSVLEGLAARKAALHIQQNDYYQLEEYIILGRQYFQAGHLERVVEKNTLFHQTIVKLSKNPSLIQMMDQVRTEIVRYRFITSSVGFRSTGFDEHEAILQSINNRDADKAEELMKNHIQDDLENILSGFNQYQVEL